MAEESRLYRIDIAAAEALSQAGQADVAFYLPEAADHAPVLYRQADIGLEKPDFVRLRDSGVPFLYVHGDDLRHCETQLESRLAALLTAAEVVPAEKARIVHQVATGVARDLTSGPVDTTGVTRASRVIDSIIGTILNDHEVAQHMLTMAAHERTTASHMFVVSALAVMLGAEVFGSDYEMLRSLGLAGMMHDLGKLGIPADVLNKASPLTSEELALVHQHPIESVRLLGNDPHVTPAVRQTILQHHEWLDGRGYPLGVSGDDVLPGSRIISIVDSFHAMIGRRPYRRPMTAAEAHQALSSQAGKQFDPEFLKLWGAFLQRSWAEGAEETPPLIQPPEEHSSKHEHRAANVRRKTFGSRPMRFACRNHIRVRCIYAGRLHDTTCASDEFEASVRDISRRGLCLSTEHPMYRGEVIHVELRQPFGLVWVRGTIAWCRRDNPWGYRVGIHLLHRIPTKEAYRHASVVGMGDDEERLLCPLPSETEKTATETNAATRELTREEAAEAIDDIGRRRKLTAADERMATRLASHRDPDVRRQTVDLLMRLSTKAARIALLALIRDDDDTVRETAVAAAGSMGMAEATSILRHYLTDPNERIALRAAGALGQLGETDGLPLIQRSLESNGPNTRLAAHVFGLAVGQRFPGNTHGVSAARRYLQAHRPSLTHPESA